MKGTFLCLVIHLCRGPSGARECNAVAICVYVWSHSITRKEIEERVMRTKEECSLRFTRSF